MDEMRRYERWLNTPGLDGELKGELLAIQNDKAQIEDRFYRDLEFGTAGMRGILGAGTNRMNVYTVAKATAGLAALLMSRGPEMMKRGVAIAYDSRKKSREFAWVSAGVLCGSGVHVYLYDSLRPVPMLSFAVRELRCAAGIVITASHNPPQYNGYKAYGPDGAQMGPEDAAALTALIEAVDELGEIPRLSPERAAQAGLLTWLTDEFDRRYYDRVLALRLRPEVFMQAGDRLHIVYTPLHGAGSLPVQRVLAEAGVADLQVVAAQAEPDGAFPTVAVPNPEDPAALKMAIEQAKASGANLCVATDPDCDRMGIAVARPGGEFELLTGNQIGCLLLHYILSARRETGRLAEKSAVVKTIVTTGMADVIAADFGARVYDVLTGFKFIAGVIEKLEQEGGPEYVFGFEESYGYMAGPFVRDKDAVQACLLIAEAAAWYCTRGQTLYDGLRELYRRYGYFAQRVRSFAYEGRSGTQKMACIMAALRAAPPREMGGLKVIAVRDYQSGLRTDHVNGETSSTGLPESDVLYYELEGDHQCVVRPSGTEPKIKLYCEAHDENEAAAHDRCAAMERDMAAHHMAC